jgi:hypothetical protein
VREVSLCATWNGCLCSPAAAAAGVGSYRTGRRCGKCLVVDLGALKHRDRGRRCCRGREHGVDE